MKLLKDRAENPTTFELVAAGVAHAPGHSFGIWAQAAGNVYVTGEDDVTVAFAVTAGPMGGVIAKAITTDTDVDIIAMFGN